MDTVVSQVVFNRVPLELKQEQFRSLDHLFSTDKKYIFLSNFYKVAQRNALPFFMQENSWIYAKKEIPWIYKKIEILWMYTET